MTKADRQGQPLFRAVLFDLLTALMDSWSLWIDVAADGAHGREQTSKKAAHWRSANPSHEGGAGPD